MIVTISILASTNLSLGLPLALLAQAQPGGIGTPLFEAGRGAHPNVWMLEAAYPLGSEAWTVTVHGLGPSGEYKYQEPRPRPEVHELYMTAFMMWQQRRTSRPLLPFPEAVASASLITLRRSNPQPITSEIGKYNSWEQAIYLFAQVRTLPPLSQQQPTRGRGWTPQPTAGLSIRIWRGFPSIPTRLVSACARVHAAIEEERLTCLWSSPPMRGGFEVRFLIDLGPWDASLVTIELLQGQSAPPPAVISSAPRPANQRPLKRAGPAVRRRGPRRPRQGQRNR